MVTDHPTARRFWSYVDKSAGPDACWLWTASTFRKGYGQFTYGGHKSIHIGAHRAAYILTHGPIPKKLLVLHRCDNPPCCNPAHLFLGTHADNSADSLAKLRGPRTRKLAPAAARKIRHLYAAGGISQTVLARQFGVGQSQISRIIRGRQWK